MRGGEGRGNSYREVLGARCGGVVVTKVATKTSVLVRRGGFFLEISKSRVGAWY